MSRRGQHGIDLRGHLLFAMPFVILMDYCFLPYLLRSKSTTEMSNNSGGLILWSAKLLLLLGFVPLTMQGLSEIIKKIAVMTGAMPHPTPFISAHQSAELEGAALAEQITAGKS